VLHSRDGCESNFYRRCGEQGKIATNPVYTEPQPIRREGYFHMASTSIDLTQGTLTNLQLDERGRLRLEQTETGHAVKGEFVSAVYDLGSPTPAIQLHWVAQWTAPQQWQKFAGNPIYGPDQSGAWDNWTNGVSVVPTADGKKYRMYYCGRAGAGIGFAEASVDNPTEWTEHPASPVLTPRADNWEGNMINQPRVVAVTATHWHMYYTGWGFDGPGTKWAMGLAESFDGGTTWQRVQDDPMMERGDIDSPDGGGACVPMVLRVGDQWMMWYTAGKLNPDGHQNIHLCLATSDDGLHWHKHPGNPVLGDDFVDGATRSVTSRCYVRHDDGVFRMWYSFAKPDYKIFYAESLDGIHWERSPLAPVLDASPAPAWDDVMVEYPEVQIVDGVYRLWFCGNGYGSVGYAEGVSQTGVRVFARSGETVEVDRAWTEWVEVESNQPNDVRQYCQVRAELWSKDERWSPALNGIRFSAKR